MEQQWKPKRSIVPTAAQAASPGCGIYKLSFSPTIITKMRLSKYAVQQLVPYLTGDGTSHYRKGPALVILFNKYGARDVYNFDAGGLPLIGKANGHPPSRTQYVEHRLNGLSDNPVLRDLLEEVLTENNLDEHGLQNVNAILQPEGFTVRTEVGSVRIDGRMVDRRLPVVNQAHFRDIQDQVLAALDGAAVTIDVAMAWFTNDVIRDKLLEKVGQGVAVRLVIYNDGVNAAHGVDLTGINHKVVRGLRGGIMHNKFCVIDNQVVITGSYNWSSNAEFRNDENVTVQMDPQQATRYSIEFRTLWQ
jgi:hypothetical protein